MENKLPLIWSMIPDSTTGGFPITWGISLGGGPCLGIKIIGLSGRGWPTDIEFDSESEPIIFLTTQTLGMLSTKVDIVLPMVYDNVFGIYTPFYLTLSKLGACIHAP